MSNQLNFFIIYAQRRKFKRKILKGKYNYENNILNILLFDVFLSILHASSFLFFLRPIEFNSFNNFNSPVSVYTVGIFIVFNLSMISFSLYETQLRLYTLFSSEPRSKTHQTYYYYDYD